MNIKTENLKKEFFSLLEENASYLDFLISYADTGYGFYDSTSSEQIWLSDNFKTKFEINDETFLLILISTIKQKINGYKLQTNLRQNIFNHDTFNFDFSHQLTSLICNCKIIPSSESGEQRVILAFMKTGKLSNKFRIFSGSNGSNNIKFSSNNFKEYKLSEDYDVKSNYGFEIGKIQLQDLFSNDEIRKFQESFSEITGVSSVIIDAKGDSAAISDKLFIIREDSDKSKEKIIINCVHQSIALKSPNQNDPVIYKCPKCGLFVGLVSISAGRQHIANLMAGPIRNENVSIDELLVYADELGIGRDEYKKEILKIKVMSRNQFEKTIEFLSFYINSISEKSFQNFVLSKFLEERFDFEKALIESEERLRLSLQATKQGLYDLNVITGEAVVNDEYAEMLGYLPANFTETFQNWLERLHPDDKYRCLKTYYDYISGANPEYSSEFRQKDIDGNWIWIMSLGKIVEYDSDGKPKRILGTHTNITDKKLVEEALQISNQTFSDVMYSIPSGLFIYQYRDDDKLFLIYGNPEAERLTKLNIKQNLGKEFNEIWPNAQKAGITDKFLSVIKTGKNIEIDDILYFDDKISGVFKIRTFKMQGLKLGIAFENITEIKKAESALKESEERYRMLIENQNEFIVKVNVSGKFQYVSPSYCTLFGKSEKELLGLSFRTLIHPLDYDISLKEFENLNIYPHTAFIEHRIITPDGLKWLAWSFKSVKNQDNSIDYFIGVGRDVTNRKQAEFALEEKKQQSELLAKIAFRLSELGKSEDIITFLNQQLKEITKAELIVFSDYNAESKSLITRSIDAEPELKKFAARLIGNKVNNFITPVNDKFYNELVEKIIIRYDTFTDITNGIITPVIDKSLRMFSGLSKFFSISYVVEGVLFGVSVIALKEKQVDPPIDLLKSFAHISAVSLRRKIAEEKLKVLSRGIQQSPALVMITDSNGIIEYINPSFTEVTGYDLDYIIGKNPKILKSGLTPPEVYRDLWEHISKGLDWTGEFLNRKKNGELYWVSSVISPILNENNEITNFIAVKQDITALKNIANDLIKAKEKAEESDKLKTAFLQNMSHEIRTPLNGIIGFTQMLQLPDIKFEEIISYAKTIQSSGKRLIEIVNNVMELSKIETGQVSTHLNEVNLDKTIDYLFKLFANIAKEKGLELKTRIISTDSQTTILTDETKLNQILINLIGNAVKFTKSGNITFGYDVLPNEIRFFVEDTGVGISPAQQMHIFERFYQGDTRISRNYEGAGLGLAICKGFIDLLGGEIGVNSKEGIGSEFYFTLKKEY